MTLFKYWNTVCLRASYPSCVSSFAQSLFFLYLSHTLTSVYSFTAVNRVSDRIVFAFIIVCNTSAFFRFLWGELYTRTSTNTHTSTFKILFTRSCHILHCTFYKLFVSLPSSPPLFLYVCMYVCVSRLYIVCRAQITRARGSFIEFFFSLSVEFFLFHANVCILNRTVCPSSHHSCEGFFFPVRSYVRFVHILPLLQSYCVSVWFTIFYIEIII